MLQLLQNFKSNSLATTYCFLLIAYFGIQPWDIYLADYTWIILALISSIYVMLHKYRNTKFKLPKELKTILWLFFAIPLVSLLSYWLSPLDTLKPKLLEPDTRWWLAIPIIIASRQLGLNPISLLLCLISYAISTFISALHDTNYLETLYIRADGNENAVPYGMFNSSIALILLAYLKSNYLENLKTLKQKRIIQITIITGFLFSAFAAYLSGTRAAMVLLAIGLITLYIYHYDTKKSLLISSLIIIMLSLWAQQNPTTALSKKIELSYHSTLHYLQNKQGSEKTSLGQRLEQWKESWCIFTKHPIFGTGPRSFRYAHGAYGGADHCNSQHMAKKGSFQAHSVYFNTLSTLGLVGSILFTILFVRLGTLCLTNFKSNEDTISIGCKLLLVTLFCHAINGLTLDLWFRNHVIDKNLLILILPLALIFPTNYPLTTTLKSIR